MEHRRKKVNLKLKVPKAKAQGNHLRNSCGSESGKNERKPSVEPSKRTVKGCMRDQAEGNGEILEMRMERMHRENRCEVETRRTERKKQKAE